MDRGLDARMHRQAGWQVGWLVGYLVGSGRLLGWQVGSWQVGRQPGG